MKYAILKPLQKSINKSVSIPGSKSITNRALILASLTEGIVSVKNALFCDDTNAMISCLRQLGITVTQRRQTLVVSGGIRKIKREKIVLDANLSATTVRFLTALCCTPTGEKILTGKEGLRKRPIKDLVDGLKQLGVKISYVEKDGFLPIKIVSGKLHEGKIVLRGNISSQFLSSILMISPLVGKVKIVLSTKLVSKPYVALTIAMMNQFGAQVTQKNSDEFVVEKQTYKKSNILVEGDFSSASYFAAIAALTKSTIELKNLNPNSLQADKEFFAILNSMGNKITTKSGIMTVEGKGVCSVNVNMENCPDQIQTLAVLAGFAKGKTIISGTASLRVKETDRLAAIQTELQKMGIKTEIKENSLTVFGGNPHGATIETYGDHRMAMAFAVAGSKCKGIRIKNPDVVSKTFPNFFRELKKIGIGVKVATISKNNIVLIGFGGAGKTSIAPLLAKKTKKQAIEMDELIVRKSGKRSIKEIFEQLGEPAFRKLELQVSQMLHDGKDIVISCGGGVILQEEVMENLNKNGITILLNATLNTVLKRVTNISSRPLWKDKNRLKKIYAERQSLYAQYADITVSTDGKSLGEITNEIAERLGTI